MIVTDAFDDDASSIRKQPLTRPEPAQHTFGDETRSLNGPAYNSSPVVPPSPSGPPPAYPGYQSINHPSSSRLPRRDSPPLRQYSPHIVTMKDLEWPSNDTAYERLWCASSQDWEVIDEGGHGAFLGQSSAVLKSPFVLPINSDLDLFLVANTGISGHLLVEEDASLTDHAELSVRVDYYEGAKGWKSLLGSEICMLSMKEIGLGVSLTSNSASNRLLDTLSFSVVLSLPPHKSSPFYIPEFIIRMPHFSIETAALSKSYNFGTFLVLTLDGEININSVAGRDVQLITTNGPVRGSLTASRTLNIVTSNARTNVDVKLLNSRDFGPTDLTLQTNNFPLIAKITLESTADTKRGGNFRVFAKTTDARLDLAFVSTPLDSALRMVAQANNGPALIQLDAAYEGEVELRMNQDGVIDVRNMTRLDPSGRGRDRKMVWDRRTSRKVAKGVVEWKPSMRIGALGSVSVTSDEEIHIRV
ncbi:hypothetical protein K488DRAFT_87879 [Vararia minispora EC-137]|uniref:Uncharacterized protein n=1 Tax=Vararia minispora EC-137 TaxID=1314806 RepID=A0ACB8QFF3_9AGAM|nr:hypothetical protein K488DRAFT_87879 [Vararia minispora EC-137]